MAPHKLSKAHLQRLGRVHVNNECATRAAQLKELYDAERKSVQQMNVMIGNLREELESSKKVIETMTSNAFEDQKRYREATELLHKRIRSQKDHVRIALGICQRARKAKRKAKGVRQAVAVLEAAVDEEAQFALPSWWWTIGMAGPLLAYAAIAAGAFGVPQAAKTK
jgi:hypothetical protein